MSLSRINYNRKRRSDDDYCSSDSDEDAPPVKRSHALSREPNFEDLVTRKFYNLVNWIYQLNVGNARERILKAALDGLVPFEIEEEEEEEEEEDNIDVVEIKSEDDDGILEDYNYVSDISTSRDGLSKKSKPVVTYPLSSSTPVYRGYNGSRGRTLNSLSRQPVNGCNSTKTYATSSKRDKSNHQKVNFLPNITPITNPCSDVEILLGIRETPGEESDDLEIVSEISNAKSSRQTISPVISKFGQTSNECNGTSSGSIVNWKAASCERKRCLNNSNTAHEVFGLQEKHHYGLLLDKMINNPTYRPVTPEKDSKPAKFLDLISDDEPVVGGRLKKEILEKPVKEFLQKYYKPCKFQPCAPPKDSSEVEIFTVDDVPVIETKTSDDDCYKYIPKSRRGPDIFSKEWLNELKKIVILKTEQCVQNFVKKKRAAEASQNMSLLPISKDVINSRGQNFEIKRD